MILFCWPFNVTCDRIVKIQYTRSRYWHTWTIVCFTPPSKTFPMGEIQRCWIPLNNAFPISFQDVKNAFIDVPRLCFCSSLDVHYSASLLGKIQTSHAKGIVEQIGSYRREGNFAVNLTTNRIHNMRTWFYSLHIITIVFISLLLLEVSQRLLWQYWLVTFNIIQT